MPLLTTEQVLALAPDAGSAKDGSALATPRKWPTLGRDAESRMVWGECQGSGKTPYKTQADLSEPAFKCSCPSRKFPCKHSLGLLLMLAANPTQFLAAEWPAWVAEWAASREDRAEKRTAKKEREESGEEKPIDAAAKAKRIAARTDKMSAGLAELDLWLRDLVRSGIAGMESRPAAFFNTLAARLVDAQAPGASRLVRELATIPATGDGWHARMVARIGRLHLLTAAWSRYDTLAAGAQADVRAMLGWSTSEAELAGVPGINDEWTVIGQSLDEDERLRVRRTWVHGTSSDRVALLLHFAPGTAPFTEVLPPLGASLSGEIAFYPGGLPQRAFVRSRNETDPVTRAPQPWPRGEQRLANATQTFAHAIARNPWVERVPFILDGVVPEYTPRGWCVRDDAGDALPTIPRFEGWTLLAVSGARPVWMTAEWTGEYLAPLAVSLGDSLLALNAA